MGTLEPPGGLPSPPPPMVAHRLRRAVAAGWADQVGLQDVTLRVLYVAPICSRQGAAAAAACDGAASVVCRRSRLGPVRWAGIVHGSQVPALWLWLSTACAKNYGGALPYCELSTCMLHLVNGFRALVHALHKQMGRHDSVQTR